MTETQHSQEQDADLVGAALKRGGHTLAVAESLTGGLLASEPAALAMARGVGHLLEAPCQRRHALAW